MFTILTNTSNRFGIFQILDCESPQVSSYPENKEFCQNNLNELRAEIQKKLDLHTPGVTTEKQTQLDPFDITTEKQILLTRFGVSVSYSEVDSTVRVGSSKGGSITFIMQDKNGYLSANEVPEWVISGADGKVGAVKMTRQGFLEVGIPENGTLKIVKIVHPESLDNASKDENLQDYIKDHNERLKKSLAGEYI